MKIFSKLSASAMLVLTMTATANAGDCISGPLCDDGATSTTLPDFHVKFDADAQGLGIGGTVIGGSEGAEGEAFAFRDSATRIDFEAFLNSDLCATDCSDGGFKAFVQATEYIASGGLVVANGGNGTNAHIVGDTNAFVSGGMNISFPVLE